MKRILMGLASLIFLLLFVGCGNKQAESKKTSQLTYSNLVDSGTQEQVKSAFLQAGVSEEAIDDFLKDVNDYNATVEHTGLVKEGFKTVDTLTPTYDELTLGDKWLAKYPDAHGHNCRLTTYRLMNAFITIEKPEIEDDTMLFAEKEVIEKNSSLVDRGSETDFLSLFAYISTKNTTDVQKHVDVLKENWKSKGISFQNDKISMVSVVFNTNFEEQETTSQLFIGHVGLLWEDGENFLFLEKLSFSEPYQLIRFRTRQEVSDYLMNRYDVDNVTNTAIPFVMEDGELIEGYRPNPDKN